MPNLTFKILSCMLLLTIVGCAKKPQDDLRVLWPAPPTQPRLEHIGNFSAESDFPRSEGRWNIWLREMVGGFDTKSALLNPQDVYVNSNLVYVSDSARKNILVFNFEDCTISQLFGTKFQSDLPDTPSGLTADEDGNLYLVDAKKHAIYVFSPKGMLLKKIYDNKRLQYPVDIAIDKIGRLYISDIFAHKIVVYDPSGLYLFDIGERGNAPGQFSKPGGITFDNQNKLYVADSGNSRIQVFSSDGKFIKTIGKRGHTAYFMSRPIDVAIDSIGNLHILDQDYFALLTYAPDDTVLLVTGTGTESKGLLGLAKPTSLFIDSKDRIYITDTRNSRLTVWQILNSRYLKSHPITKEDIAKLNAYRAENKETN